MNGDIMVIESDGFATSVGDEECEGLAYAYCVDKNGYCVSVSRGPGDALVEVMVVDQIVTHTNEIEVELERGRFRLTLSEAAAAKLDGILEYLVPLTATDAELRDLDAALTVIFAGGERGRYVRRI